MMMPNAKWAVPIRFCSNKKPISQNRQIHIYTHASITPTLHAYTDESSYRITKVDQSWSIIVTECNKYQEEGQTGEEQWSKYKNSVHLKPSTIGHSRLHMTSHRDAQICKYWPWQYHKYSWNIKSHNTRKIFVIPKLLILHTAYRVSWWGGF